MPSSLAGMLRSRSHPRYAALTAAVVLVVGAGAAACGGDDEPTAAPTVAATPTPTPTSTPVGLNPVPGVPDDFPASAVPLVPGDYEQPLGAGAGSAAGGAPGWVLEVDLALQGEACFDAAAKRLTDGGYTKQPGEFRSGTSHQAQFTGSGYAVIISTSTTDSGGCRLGYEVGKVAAP